MYMCSFGTRKGQVAAMRETGGDVRSCLFASGTHRLHLSSDLEIASSHSGPWEICRGAARWSLHKCGKSLSFEQRLGALTSPL